MYLKQLTKCTCRPNKSTLPPWQSPPCPSRPTSTKPNPPSRRRTNLRWQPSEEEVEGSAEIAEEEVKEEEAGEEPGISSSSHNKPQSQGDQDITPHLPRPVVTATTAMVTRLGTAWPPSPAPGCPRSQRPRNEVQASLTRKIKIFNMTKCFRASDQ